MSEEKQVEYDLGCGALIAVLIICVTLLLLVGKVTLRELRGEPEKASINEGVNNG